MFFLLFNAELRAELAYQQQQQKGALIQSQTGWMWREARSHCAEQKRSSKTRKLSSHLANEGSQDSPMPTAHPLWTRQVHTVPFSPNLTRRQESSDDIRGPLVPTSLHKAWDPQLLYPPRRWVRTYLVISLLTLVELSNWKPYEIKSLSILYRLCSPQIHILMPQHPIGWYLEVG